MKKISHAQNVKKLFLLLCLLGSFYSLKAQWIQNINNHWIFGDSIHLTYPGVTSGNTVPAVSSVNHTMLHGEGLASISDGNGNLLFYIASPSPPTVHIYDASFNIMSNGSNLMGSESASMGFIIAQDPQNCKQYYVFYVSTAAGNGLRYSKVDMNANGGLGAVMTGQKDILLYNTRCEKVCLAQRDTTPYFWVVTRHCDPALGPIDELVSIPLLAGGTFGAPVVSVFPSNTAGSASTGYMSFRPDHLKMADVQLGSKKANTYDFNSSTGVFSNRVNIYSSVNDPPYGCSYSPSGNLLYITYQDFTNFVGSEILRRFDLATDPTGATFSNTNIGLSDGFHAVQRSPRGLMYVTQGSSNFLHIVNAPDNYSAPNISINGLTVPHFCQGGLPNQYFPYEHIMNAEITTPGASQQICYNTSTTLGAITDSMDLVYSWQGQILTGSGWSPLSSSYLINPNAANPTTINLTSSTTRFVITLLTTCGDTIMQQKEFVYVDSLSTPVISGALSYCAGQTITPLTSTPPYSSNGVINWYSNAGLTTQVATGTSFTPPNTPGSTTYYIVEQENASMAPQTCTSLVTQVTITIAPQIPLCYTKRAAKWYFGDSLGLNFLCSSPPTPLDDGIAEGYAFGGNNNLEGTVSISDANGDLLFYAYDSFIVNRNHLIMPNGSGILSNFSSTQGFMAVPNPTNSNRYYLFTVEATGGNTYYSEVDMSLALGLGDVVTGTKNTLLRTGCVERITAVEHCSNGTWIVVHDANNFYAYLVSAAGIAAPVISPVVNSFSTAGQMMLSPTGRHLAISRDNGGAELYTFDNESGKICHKESLSHGGMGCSFSNNGRYLYVSGMFTGMYQYDVQAATVNTSAIQVHDPFSSGAFLYGTMQLGPDCKLYTFGFNNTMGTVINSPNSAGAGCNIQPQSFPLSNLGRDARFGLPNFIQSWFKDPTYTEPVINAAFTVNTNSVCAGGNVSFNNTSTSIGVCPEYSWNFGDPSSGALNTSTLTSPTHQFNSGGTYTVTLTMHERCQVSTFTTVINVNSPAAAISGDTTVCDHANVVLVATGGGTYSWTGPTWQPPFTITGTNDTLTNIGDAMNGSANEGWYYVTVTNNGCSVTDSIYVHILGSPNVGVTIQSSGPCFYTLIPNNMGSNGPLVSYQWFIGGGGGTPNGTGTSFQVNPTVPNQQILLFVTDSAGCSAGGFALLNPLAGPANPTIFTPNSWYCMGDNITPLNSSSGDLWYSDAALTNQVGTGLNYTPPAQVGLSTYYVVDTSGGCTSPTASVTVEFTNCAPHQCATNLLSNGSFETYSACPTATQQIANATGWSGQGSYYNTICNGFYNSPMYYPYFNASNYNLGLNGGGTFPPPDGAGYASIFMGGGSGFFQHESISQQVNLYCSKQYTLQFRAMTPRSDTPPNNTLCVYGSNGTPPFSGCAPSMNLLGCLPAAGSINNYWQQFTITFTPTADYNYLVVSGQCPLGGGQGTVMLDDLFLCGNCVAPPVISSATQVTPESCAGNDGSATVNATSCSNNLTYAWALQSNPSSVVSTVTSPTTLDSGAYQVIVNDAAGCADTASVTINGSPAPSAAISYSVTAMCVSGTPVSVTQTGASGGTYSSSPGLSINPATGVIDPALSTPATYTVTYTIPASGACPAAVFTTVVSVSSSFSAVINYVTPNICSNAASINVTQTGTPGGTYSSGSGLIIDSITGSINPSMSTAGTYTVTYAIPASGGCAAFSTTDTVTVIAAPALTINGNLTVCNGQSTTLTATGASTYNWIAGTTGTNASVTIAPLTNTTYSVTGSANGCSDTATVLVSVVSTPTAAVSGNTTLCNGQSTTLTASGGTSYNWIAGTSGSSSSVTVSPASNTNYSVVVSNGTCSDTTSISVVVNPTPTVTVSGTTSLCSGQSTTLTASGAASYIWQPGGQTTNSISVSPGTTTIYTVTGTAAGCSTAVSSTVNVIATPTAVISGSATVCNGQSVTLIASGGTSFNWISGTSGNNASVSVSPVTNTNYSVIVSNGSCSDTASFSLSVVQPPVVNISGDTTVCPNQSTTLTATGGGTYLWSNGTGAASTSVSAATSAIVTVTVTSGGCSTTSNVNLIVFTVTPVSVTSTTTTVVVPDSVQLNANGSGTFSWSPSSSLSCSNCQSPYASPAQTTVYTVTVTDANGCTSSDTITIFTDILCGEIFAPTAFSPNNDGHNEVWKVYGNCISSLEVKIFDRWGKLVFTSVDPSFAWDGLDHGVIANSGLYTYTLTGILQNGEVFNKKGQINLTR